MELSITKISDKQKIKAFKVGQSVVGVLLPHDDEETEVEARQRLKEVLKDKRKLKPNENVMDLMTAKDEAKKASKKTKKDVFINVDKEGECSLSDKANKSTLHVYKSGKEIPLPAEQPEEQKVEAAKKSSTKKQDSAEPVKSASKNEKEVTNIKTEKTMKTASKKSAKKSAKKSSKKVAAKKAVKRNPLSNLIEVKAGSIPAAIKEALKQDLSKARLIVGGKQYGLRVANTWSVVKSIVEIGKDGMIMYMPNKKGYYLYNKADYKVFASIFASHSYKDNGSYAQSTVPAQYEEFFKKM